MELKLSNFVKNLSIITCAVVLANCAPRANSVAPIAVPSANYDKIDCEETKLLLAQKTAAKNALVKKQNNAATGDAVGVFLVLLPVGSIFGADNEGELAQAKGEVMALEGAVNRNCR